MRHPRSSIASLFMLFTLAAVFLIFSPNAYANTRTTGGGDLPFYARIERGLSLHTNEWAAIIFYRPSECVPNDFDLLDLFDVPRVFACTPPTTDGFLIWKREPGVGAPIQSELRGLGAVPVWFVSWADLQSGLSDNQLYISELKAMQSLMIGSACFYHETLHPVEAAKNTMISVVADGKLVNGRRFYVQATEAKGVFKTLIAFR